MSNVIQMFKSGEQKNDVYSGTKRYLGVTKDSVYWVVDDYGYDDADTVIYGMRAFSDEMEFNIVGAELTGHDLDRVITFLNKTNGWRWI